MVCKNDIKHSLHVWMTTSTPLEINALQTCIGFRGLIGLREMGQPSESKLVSQGKSDLFPASRIISAISPALCHTPAIDPDARVACRVA